MPNGENHGNLWPVVVFLCVFVIVIGVVLTAMVLTS
jgi:hypothetical protein